jgi:hypothetical protein
LEHLLGTALLRAYMHGFFIDARLYSKAAAAAAPDAYEAYRAARVASKLEEERQGRISVVRKLPKVRPWEGIFRGMGLQCSQIIGHASSQRVTALYSLAPATVEDSTTSRRLCCCCCNHVQACN